MPELESTLQGKILSIAYRGVRHASPKVMQRIAKGP